MKMAVGLNSFKEEMLMRFLFICMLLYVRWNASPISPFSCHQICRQRDKQWQMYHLHLRVHCCGVVLCLVFAQEEDKNWNTVGPGHSNIFRYFWKNLSVELYLEGGAWQVAGWVGNQSDLKAKPEVGLASVKSKGQTRSINYVCLRIHLEC